jgi:citrate lyase subunit beta/citryl-CoA lyase
MKLRSLLFVPAGDQRKMDRAVRSGADVVIFDLEDSVVADRKDNARAMLARYLRDLSRERTWQAFVRINPLATPECLDDLIATVRPGVAGIVAPKIAGPADLERLDHYLDVVERAAGMPQGAVVLLPVVTETPAAVLGLPAFRQAPSRLIGMTWGGEDLATALGAHDNRTPSGEWDDPFRLARSLCLLSAAACGVAPIDTLHADYRDDKGLIECCRAARRAGFVGKIAIHPDQVPLINDGFTPGEDELAAAREVVAAFAAAPGAGAIGLHGRMLDRPHLLLAERMLAAAENDHNT